MANSGSFNKRDNEKKRLSKRLEKQQKKEERKNNNKGKSFEDMIAYVDENGVITSTPPEAKKEEVNLEDISISTPKKEEVEEILVHRGKVDHFNSSKGYGFIKDLGTNEKYFFHVSSTEEEIDEEDIVLFELERGPKGMNAVHIKLEVK
ncbi:cold shock domain-containing protein [Parabacteroides sp. 52]|uniref:cold-shock protein n=1 Tax=unclassified Parabacteroides TaxID=2649774 RepID=UPI0013D27292|nr:MULTISPECIES: cold shock domain-containing protein [unclassified Parabacteroides]MDH6535472.1 cold shock CspA family protein [Parabacteroides sp. PM5-20]NDV55949.1 cold shock domain-containing protein [Parabacteroides sp. 52]